MTKISERLRVRAKVDDLEALIREIDWNQLRPESGIYLLPGMHDELVIATARQLYKQLIKYDNRVNNSL